MPSKVVNLGKTPPLKLLELLAYVQKRVLATATGIQQIDLNSITWNVYQCTDDMPTPLTGTRVLMGTGTVPINTNVYNTPQAGTAWTRGGPGFNLVVDIPGNMFPKGDMFYLIELIYDIVGAIDKSADWFQVQTFDVPVP